MKKVRSGIELHDVFLFSKTNDGKIFVPNLRIGQET